MLSAKSQEAKIRQMQPLILLGMHRSGTSLMVRLLADIGIHMGTWLSRDAEAVHFQGLNRCIYDDAGSSWGQVASLIEALASEEFVTRQTEFVRLALFNGRFTDFIRYFGPILQAEAMGRALLDDKSFIRKNALITLYFGSQLWEKVCNDEPFTWGWKDPRTTLTFPIWMRVFPNARYLHVVRNGIDVAISTHRRSERQQKKIYKRLFPLDYCPITLDFDYCFRLWETYVEFVFEQRDLFAPEKYMEVRYEDILDNPADHLRRVAEFVDHPIHADVLSATCEQIDRGRLDNSEYARPYRDEITRLAASPLMEQLGYSYPIVIGR